MKQLRLSAFLLAAAFVAVPLSFAAEKYDRNKICPSPNGLECDLLIERAVAADVPGVIHRSELVLRIRAKNGKTIQRESTDPKLDGGQRVWVCDHFPTYGLVRVCYRLWEKATTEYVDIETGDSVVVKGFPKYSPSGDRALFIDSYAGEVFGIDIWRFEKNRMVREFRYQPPPEIPSDMGEWKSEQEIVLVSQFRADVTHRLVNKDNRWTLLKGEKK